MNLKTKIVLFFSTKCPICDGTLHVVDVHITTFWGELNVYECDKCKRRFI
nr:MAG TPA: Transcription initiation factor IIE, alpha FINGER, Transcription [Caudoviricetes sp.]